MYCYKCGKKIRDDSEFCSGCGAKIKEEKTSESKEEVVKKVKVEKEKSTSTDERKCWSVFAKIGCLMSIGAFFVDFVAFSSYDINLGIFLMIFFNVSLVFSILGRISKEKKITATWGVVLSAIGMFLIFVLFSVGGW